MPPISDDSNTALGNAADAPSPTAEFDAALNEAIAKEVSPDPSADDLGGDHTPGEDAAEPGDKAPAVDAAALGDTASATAQAGEAPQDIWANAPQQLRDAYEAEKRNADLRIRSMAGRHSSLERQLQQERQQRAQGQQPQGQVQDDPAQGRETGGAYVPATSLEADTIKQLREDYPEVAGPLIDLIAAQQARLDQMAQPVQQMQQQQATAFVTEQEKLLTDQVPDWQDAVMDDRFAGWLQSEPTSVQDAMQRNFSQIVDGADAALVVSRFKAAVGFAAPSSAAPAAQPQDDRRARQLAAGRDSAASPPPASNVGPSDQDFDGSLNYWLDKAEKQAASR
jgi:hypothetical protein